MANPDKCLEDVRVVVDRLSNFDAVIFDIGNVLITCGADYMFNGVLRYPRDRTHLFLTKVLDAEAIGRIDEGELIAEVVAERATLYPEFREWLYLYRDNWELTMGPCISEMVYLAENVIGTCVPTYSLSNWPVEKIGELESRLPVLRKFEGLLFSGQIGIRKPKKGFFRQAAKSFSLASPHRCLFIDDVLANVTAAREVGYSAVMFEGFDKLVDWSKE